MVLRVFRAIGILIVAMVLFQLSYGYVRADFNLENWQFYKTVTLPLEMEEKEFIERIYFRYRAKIRLELKKMSLKKI